MRTPQEIAKHAEDCDWLSAALIFLESRAPGHQPEIGEEESEAQFDAWDVVRERAKVVFDALYGDGPFDDESPAGDVFMALFFAGWNAAKGRVPLTSAP